MNLNSSKSINDNVMATAAKPFRFEPPGSSSSDDDSDCDDRRHVGAKIHDDNDEIVIKNDHLNPSLSRPSPKLTIVDQSKQSNTKNKFSIWSEILMEQQLTDTMNETLEIKDRRAAARRRKRLRLQKRKCQQQQQQNESNDRENYFQWSQKDFEQKFAPKISSSDGKPKRIRKPGIVGEIAYKLREKRTDIISKFNLCQKFFEKNHFFCLFNHTHRKYCRCFG